MAADAERCAALWLSGSVASAGDTKRDAKLANDGGRVGGGRDDTVDDGAAMKGFDERVGSAVEATALVLAATA